MKHKQLAAAGLATIVLLLTACGAPNPAASPTDESYQPVTGGTITEVEPVASLLTWVPHTSVGGGYTYANLFRNIADTLIYPDPEQGLVPGLASQWKVSDDQRTFTFHLRDGVTFSDGTPLTAEVVKYNFDLNGLGDTAKGLPVNPYYLDYDSASAPDERTVIVKFKEANSRFLQVVSSSAASAIVAKSTLDLPVTEQGKPESVIGTGPFVFESATKGEQIVLKRREGYVWPPATSKNTGAAWVDKVVLKFSTDPAVRSAAIVSGDAQLTRTLLPTDEAVVTSAGASIVLAGSDVAPISIIFRPDNPYVSDVRVRHAISIAFDREKFPSFLSDSYQVAKSALPATYKGFVDLSADLEYNAELAKQLLDEAGWELNPSTGFREKDGVRLTVPILGGGSNGAFIALVDYITTQLRAIGIDAPNRASDSAAARRADNDPASVADTPLNISQYWVINGFEGRFDTKAGNWTFNQEIADLIHNERKSTSEEERFDYLKQQQEWLVAENWWISPLLEATQIFAVGPTLQGFATDQDADVLFQQAYLSTP